MKEGAVWAPRAIHGAAAGNPFLNEQLCMQPEFFSEYPRRQQQAIEAGGIW